MRQHRCASRGHHPRSLAWPAIWKPSGPPQRPTHGSRTHRAHRHPEVIADIDDDAAEIVLVVHQRSSPRRQPRDRVRRSSAPPTRPPPGGSPDQRHHIGGTRALARRVRATTPRQRGRSRRTRACHRACGRQEQALRAAQEGAVLDHRCARRPHQRAARSRAAAPCATEQSASKVRCGAYRIQSAPTRTCFRRSPRR
jgi:hypothetical protein